MSYRIEVAGRLGPEWCDWFEGLTLDVHAGTGGRTTTVLTGSLPDTTALMGLLNRLYVRGARLLALEYRDDRGKEIDAQV